MAMQVPYRHYLYDMESLLSLAHDCAPLSCRQIVCCCSHYEVCVEWREIDRLTGCMAAAARYAPHLRLASGRLENVFEPVGHGLYALDTDENGCCLFAFRDSRQQVLCSLHAAALDLGLPPFKVKPRSCALWPLTLSEDKPRIVSVQEEAFAFPCNRRRKGRPARLHAGVSAIIREVFGPGALRRMEEAIKK